MAAAYERQWIVAPKAPEPSMPVVSDSTTQPPKATSPTVPPKVPRKFIPALPSNPRPKRRPSEDSWSSTQDTQAPLLTRSATTIARVGTTPRLSIAKLSEAPSSPTTKAPPNPPPIRAPTPIRKDSSDSQKDVAVQINSSIPTRKNSLPPSPESAKGDGSSLSDAQIAGSTILADSNLFNSQQQQPLYLRVIDTPPSQRSSDTTPVGYSLEAANETGDVLSTSPVNITPSDLLESLGAVEASPPSSGDESDPKTPLTPLAEAQPSLQPAPLSLKPRATIETLVIQPPLPTPPAKIASPPSEVPLPPVADAKAAQKLHKRALSVKFESQKPSENPHRKSSSIESLAPRSLSTHLLALDNTPRKIYLATHSPFLRLISASQASTTLLSRYLARERLYLHSTIRLLSLLIANIILPKKPSGLICRRRGGIREKQGLETETAEKERKEKGQKDLNPRMGANISVEVASGVASMGMGLVLGGFAGIGTGIGLKTASGAAGVGLSQLGNAASDLEQENVEEGEKNVNRDVGERACDFLVGSLVRTRRILGLFEEVEEDISGIDLDGSEAEIREEGGMSALTMFVRLFGEIGGAVEKRERSLLAGLVMLYAREKAHLDSWLDVKATLSNRPQTRPTSVSLSQKRKIEPDHGAVRVYILPEFTSDESVTFVDDLGKLIDDLWADKHVKRDGNSKFLERKDILEAKKGRMRGGGWENDMKGMEELFEMVLDIQGRFWPVC